jgi:sugar lactone lactonase YvrE
MTTIDTLWFRPLPHEAGYLPEGPRELGDRIAWVNIQNGADAAVGHLHVRSWDGSYYRRHTFPARPGFALPTSRPGVVLAGCDKVIGLFDTATDEWTPLAAIPDTHPRTIINDAEVTPDGRAVVFGTKDTTFADPIAHLYLFTLAGNVVSVLADGQTCSNGKVFADGGRTLYDIDTPRKVVTRYRFDPAARTIRDDGIALDLRHRDDFPDGMCDAGDGTVIVAFYNPNPAEYGTAFRYRLGTGEVLHEWHTPGSPRVTCPLLVRRPGGVKLVLTTAIEGMPAEQLARCPNAGCLFVADAVGCDPPPPTLVVI